MKRNMVFIFTAFILIFFSCVKNETTQINLDADKNYFPLQVGKYWEFEVDSVLFRQGKLLDSVRFFAREEIVLQGTDSIGPVFTILRSQKNKMSDSWFPTASYTARVSDQKALRNESNLNFIKLVFPIYTGLSWNGLANIQTDQVFDIEGESVAVYTDWESFRVREPVGSYMHGTLNFNEVITVLQTDEDNLINRRYSVEKYAKNVGLVYKEMMILDCNNTINNCGNSSLPWRSRATKGFILRQQIIKHN